MISTYAGWAPPTTPVPAVDLPIGTPVSVATHANVNGIGAPILFASATKVEAILPYAITKEARRGRTWWTARSSAHAGGVSGSVAGLLQVNVRVPENAPVHDAVSAADQPSCPLTLASYMGAVHWSHPAYANRHIVARNDREILSAALGE